MTLDEAIKHYKEVATELEEEAVKYCCDDTEIMNKYYEYVDGYRQLAEWLKELEWRRNAMVEIREAMLIPASIAERISEEISTECWYRWVKMKASEVNADDELQ